MWFLMLAVGVSQAAEPSVDRLQRNALQTKRSESGRMRAIVALAERGTDESNWALTEILDRLDPETELAKVATAAVIQNADLAELARQAWPAWAQGYVTSRIDALLPDQCDDPEVRALPIEPARLVRHCGHALDVEALAADVARGSSTPVQLRAARLLRELAIARQDEVVAAVASEFAWTAEAPPDVVGVEPVLGELGLPEEARGAIGLELVTWRVHLTLRGAQEVPARLKAELGAIFAPELEAFGEPELTLDWLHLLAATGADPAAVLDRLRLRGDYHWEVVVDADRQLRGSVRDAIPLLAHRSSIVRARAALRLEENPMAARDALDRAWRLRPGRGAPLRGDVAPPMLERTEAGSERWAKTLVRWVKRSSRQNDDASLRATLWFLSDPSLTTAMNHTTRQRTAEACLQVARRDETRSDDLVQAMDAVLRGVPFGEGERPAPDDFEVDAVVWERQVAPDDRAPLAVK